MEPTDRLTRLADLSAQVDLLRREIAEARAEVTPFASVINPPRVNPNELIESAWGNQVVDALWQRPWGCLNYEATTVDSPDIGTNPMAVPGWSIIVDSPGGRLVELQTVLQLHKFDGIASQCNAEYRGVGGGAGQGLSSTTAAASTVTQLVVRAVFFPPAGIEQYDLWAWTSAGSVRTLALGSPVTTFSDLGPYPPLHDQP